MRLSDLLFRAEQDVWADRAVELEAALDLIANTSYDKFPSKGDYASFVRDIARNATEVMSDNLQSETASVDSGPRATSASEVGRMPDTERRHREGRSAADSGLRP